MIRGPGWRPDVVSRLGLDAARERLLIDFCERWQVSDLELFGSVLRAGFGPESDVDVLVTFEMDAVWGLFEHAAMEEELAHLLGRPVDLLTRRSVERSENRRRRASILKSAALLLSTAAAPVDDARVST